MDKTIFVINTGSESRKYALYRNGTFAFFARFENVGGTRSLRFQKTGEKTESREITEREFDEALSITVKLMEEHGIVSDFKKEVSAAGIRVVAPGTAFASHREIDAAYRVGLQNAKAAEPLHVSPVLRELAALETLSPALRIVAVSDSAFHQSMPIEARLYGIPRDTDGEELRRFGYHGLSAASVVAKLPALLGAMPERAILCHLGGGGSIVALRGGKTVDTSMGYTPLEGLLMATRPGDIDAGVILALLRRFGGDTARLEACLFDSSGLKGMSGLSGDIRELLTAEREGNTKAKEALGTYLYRIQKYIGAYVAALGGCDALIFSGTVGERSFILRKRLCDTLGVFGVKLDDGKNNKEIETAPEAVHAQDSRVPVLVIPTDEMGEIARETARLMK